MNSIEQILEHYWGYKKFRPFQKEIIESVVAGKDTIALLPTGGGKSLCFQLPSLINEGITVVVSPLIALMQDQITQLKKKNIPAMMLERPTPNQSLEDQLDNLNFGPYKILFLTPERLLNETVASRIAALPIGLLAIDEAHCVSEWGHDFRPAFLQIKNFSERLQAVPKIALTASATPEVLKDIIGVLGIHKPEIYQSSFDRPNLEYQIENTTDKIQSLLKLLGGHSDCCIIYCRTRKQTEFIYQQLKEKYPVAFFHGGLTENEKKERLHKWLAEEIQIIVATVAFGMGIDKPNVRQVIHMSPPESLEHYYQESGRAGRDGQAAKTSLLISQSDFKNLRSQFLDALPTKEELHFFYKSLCSFLQIAYGEGNEQRYYFNFNSFCTNYNLSPSKALQSFQLLDREGLWEWKTVYREQINIQFLATSSKILNWLKQENSKSHFFQLLWRLYPRIVDHPQTIDVEMLANNTELAQSKIIRYLREAKKDGWLSLEWIKSDSCLDWTHPREEPYTLSPIVKRLKKQYQQKEQKIKAVEYYCTNTTLCKKNLLLQYFGEKPAKICKKCSASSCTSEWVDEADLKKNLLESLQIEAKTTDLLVEELPYPKENIILILHEWASNHKIVQNKNYQWELYQP